MNRNRRRVLLLAAVIFLAMATIGIVGLAARVQALRAHRATGPNWSFPSRVYSDGLPLEPGQWLPAEHLVAQLEARGYRRVTGEVVPGTYSASPGGYEIGLRGFPEEPSPRGTGGPERVRLRIRGGRLVSVERRGGYPGARPPDRAHAPWLEPMLVSLLFDRERVWRTPVSLARVPEAVREAVLSAEDRRFWGHLGVDLEGTTRALWTNVSAGEIREGGSTITQQLARSLFVGRKRSVARKIAEVPVALGLEMLLTKHQILEMYLNSAYWGQAAGFQVGGVAQAARWYFDAPLESLGVLEGATLAAILPAPNARNPFEHPGLVLEKRNEVLEDMVESGRLAASEAARLRRLPLGVRRGTEPAALFPSYTEYVQSLLEDALPREAATRHGLAVFTALDPAWQRRAESALRSGLAALDGGRGRLQGAFVVLEPGTRAVRVLVGGRSPRPGDYNRAYQARRQTGSAIKPIVYAAAFTSSYGLTPATTVPDTLRTFGKGRWAWRPRNFDGSTHPEVTLAKALEKSLNVATANVVDLIGPGEVARVGESFGLGRMKAVPSIGLGTNEVSLLQLTNAFAVFEDAGRWRAASPVRVVLDRSGQARLGPPERTTQALPEGVAALMTGLLQNVIRYGVAYPLAATYGFDRPVAGKTGTTDEFRDAWFVGYTPQLVAGVWVGYDRPRSLGRQAAHTALPIWARTVGAMLAGFPAVPFESDRQLEWLEIDPWTGFLADSLCPREQVPFLPATGPAAYCQHGWNYGWEFEDLASLYADTSWLAPYEWPDSVVRGAAPDEETSGEEPIEEPDPDDPGPGEPDSALDAGRPPRRLSRRRASAPGPRLPPAAGWRAR